MPSWPPQASAYDMATSGGRAHTTRWRKLRPVNLDPLEEMGLPSKGEKRLLDFNQQEQYYQRICDRYLAFCADSGTNLSVRESATSNSASSTSQLQRKSDTGTQTSVPFRPRNSNASAASIGPVISIQAESGPQGENETSLILMAMRKLREGIVASHRTDDFANKVYFFSIRTSILMQSWASYHPALLRLLYHMHPKTPLESAELQEFAGYLMLDLACRQGKLGEAHRVRVHFGVKGRKVKNVIAALVRDDWDLWWRTKKDVDRHLVNLMGWAEQGLRTHALKCLGRSYFGVDLVYLEKVTERTWKQLVEEDNVGWELLEEKVVIRKPKVR